MLKRNEMIGVLQHLDEYDAVAFINAEGDPAVGLLKRLDCSEPQTFMAIDAEADLIETPLEVVYNPFTDENLLIWRPDADTAPLEGVRLATVGLYPIRTLIAEVASYVFGLERTDTEDDEVIAELVDKATGGEDDEQD